MMIHSLSSISLMLTYSMYIFSLYNACSASPLMLAKANSCIPVQQNSSSPMYIPTSTLQLHTPHHLTLCCEALHECWGRSSPGCVVIV